MAEHYETWLIFAYGFARARCDDCGHDFLVAFSCKGRGVCPSCATRGMAKTAAHLGDYVFPRLPVCQWVLSVPKRLRYFIQCERVPVGDQVLMTLSEPMPLGVWMLAQVPAGTYFQALPW